MYIITSRMKGGGWVTVCEERRGKWGYGKQYSILCIRMNGNEQGFRVERARIIDPERIQDTDNNDNINECRGEMR